MLKDQKEIEHGLKRPGTPIGDQKDLSKYPKPTLPKIKPKRTRRSR